VLKDNVNFKTLSNFVLTTVLLYHQINYSLLSGVKFKKRWSHTSNLRSGGAILPISHVPTERAQG